MVLTDYIDRRQEDRRNDRSSVGNLSLESRTRYGLSFAAASSASATGEKKTRRCSFRKRSSERKDSRNGENGAKAKKKNAPRMIGDLKVTPITYLTQKQRKRIVDTWKSIADRRLLSQRIYMQVFMHKPSLKSLYTFRDVPIDELARSAFFNRQSAIFADFLHTLVGYVQLDSENLLCDLCHRVGVKHAQLTSIDFEPEWWRLFLSAALDCLMPYFPPGRRGRPSSSLVAQIPVIGHLIKDAYKQAWSILLQHSVTLMSQAFLNYRTRRCRSGGSSSYELIDRRDGRGSSSCFTSQRLGYEPNGFDTDFDECDDLEDDQIRLQLVIVTTPVEDSRNRIWDTNSAEFDMEHMNLDEVHHEADNELENEIENGETVELCENKKDSEKCSFQSEQEANHVTCGEMTTSISLPPYSWEATRKQILRLCSLEDWDLST